MFEKTNGSRAEVWHGTAKKTCGGLTKSHLMMNKHGRIVSRRKHASGKKSIKHLEKLGYKAKKGHFMLFHKGHRGTHKMSRKMRGGTGAPTGMGLQGTPAGNAMAGIATPMPMMKKGGNGMMMDKMMMKGGDGMMMDKMMMDKGMMDKGMMDKGMMMKGGNGMMMKKGMMGGKRHSRKYMRGGMVYGGPLSPHSYDGKGVGTSGAGLQIMATTMS
jgi:hypothetical protein